MFTSKHFSIVLFSLLTYFMYGAASAQATCSGQVVIFHAGSLNDAFKAVETEFTQDTGICVTDKAFGSLDLIRQAAAGGQAADIVVPADHLDIDLFLNREGYTDFDIQFAEGKMVLAYLESDIVTSKGYTVADNTPFNPPSSIPNAVTDWYNILLKSNVTIGSSHLFMDPGGYRAHMIFQLAQTYYGQPNLYNNLLEHVVSTPSVGASSGTFVLGKQFNFQISYEHSAQARAKTNPDYRYVNLPDNINLGNAEKNCYYKQSVIMEPGLFGTGFVPVPASRVVWGISVLKDAPNKDNAVKFLQYLLGPVGQAALATYGPTPINPPLVNAKDYKNVPKSLKSLVQRAHTFKYDKKGCLRN